MKYLFLLLAAVITACSVAPQDYTHTNSVGMTNAYYYLYSYDKANVSGDIDSASSNFAIDDAVMITGLIIFQNSAKSYAYGDILISSDADTKITFGYVSAEKVSTDAYSACIIGGLGSNTVNVEFKGPTINNETSGVPINDAAYLGFYKPFSLTATNVNISNLTSTLTETANSNVSVYTKMMTNRHFLYSSLKELSFCADCSSTCGQKRYCLLLY